MERIYINTHDICGKNTEYDGVSWDASSSIEREVYVDNVRHTVQQIQGCRENKHLCQIMVYKGGFFKGFIYGVDLRPNEDKEFERKQIELLRVKMAQLLSKVVF